MAENEKQSIRKSVEESTKQAVQTMEKDKLKDDDEQISDVKGKKGKGQEIEASISGEKYFVKPAPLDGIPAVIKHIKKIEKILEGKDIMEALASDNSVVISEMASLMAIGLNGQGLTSKKVASEFSLGDFPKVYKVILDVNDFLAEMRGIYQIAPSGI